MTTLKTAAWFCAAFMGVGASVIALICVLKGWLTPDVANPLAVAGLVQTILCVVAGCFSAAPMRKGISAWTR